MTSSAPLPAAREPRASPARQRLSGNDRRASIVAAATAIFAMNGYDGAKTLQIARAAGVSEALVYRHFPSKAALYRAVLRRIIIEQDANMASVLTFEPSGPGLIVMLLYAVRHALLGPDAPNSQGMRLVYGSLAGDGSHARLVYRRAARLALPYVRKALRRAEADGDVTMPVSPESLVNFVEHVTSMIQMTRLTGTSIISYGGNDAALTADAVRFCARGIGLRPELVETMLAEALAATQDGVTGGA